MEASCPRRPQACKQTVTEINFNSIAQPLTIDDPCGPDLDGAGDETYLNFLANAEGMLPSSFFTDGQPFDRGGLDIDNQIASLGTLLARTRDLRLMALLARFLLLKDDIAGFGQMLEVIAIALETQWEAIHPRAEDGSFSLRAAIVGTLDVPTVVYPLQYLPLCDNRRLGKISFRTQMYALGDAKPRDGEAAHPQAVIQQALREAEADVMLQRASLVGVRDALQRIHSAWTAHADFMSAPRLDQVTGIVDRILAFLDTALLQQSGTAAKPGPASPSPAGQDAGQTWPSVRNAEDVRLALKAVAAYFHRLEPSSPVLPLVLQAEQLIGKSLLEILQILVPNHLAEAAYPIGGQRYFQLPVERLSGQMEMVQNPELSAADATEPLASAAGPEEGEEAPVARTRDAAPGQDGLTVENRRHAMSVLDQVATFLRGAEPSNPIPWLIERAGALADQDFLGILHALLPPGAMREVESGGDGN
jgi:type VI secretion system protein ImpA